MAGNFIIRGNIDQFKQKAYAINADKTWPIDSCVLKLSDLQTFQKCLLLKSPLKISSLT